ncbi:MAG: hypothetical protein WCI74_09640, partial [Actinomycetes bacterium]
MGWQRLWVPNYFCETVVKSMTRELPLARYDATKLGPEKFDDLRDDDAVLALSLFGQPPEDLGCVPPERLILDVTHDPIAPWIREVDVEWVVASLRKTLPIPDGGVVWSPRGVDVLHPPDVTEGHALASATMLMAMAMKGDYLSGGQIAKSAYLPLIARAEA